MNPDGVMIPLEVLDYVPYLADTFNKSNAPELTNGSGCPALTSAQFKTKRRKLQNEEHAAFLNANTAVQTAALAKVEVAAPSPAAQAAEPEELLVNESPPGSDEELFGEDDAVTEEDKKFLWFTPEEANEGPAAPASEPEEATEIKKIDG